jgi:hypothetical protein
MNRHLSLTVLLLLAVASGCNTDRDLATKRDLLAIGMEYHWFFSTHGRAPKTESELESFENAHFGGTSDEAERVSAALKSGSYVVVWNAELGENPSNLEDRILAYVVNAPIEGGLVCFQNTLVERVTKDGFADAMAKTYASLTTE